MWNNQISQVVTTYCVNVHIFFKLYDRFVRSYFEVQQNFDEIHSIACSPNLLKRKFRWSWWMFLVFRNAVLHSCRPVVYIFDLFWIKIGGYSNSNNLRSYRTDQHYCAVRRYLNPPSICRPNLTNVFVTNFHLVRSGCVWILTIPKISIKLIHIE